MAKQEWFFRGSEGMHMMFVQEANGKMWFAQDDLRVPHFIGDSWASMENFISVSGWFRRGIPINKCAYRKARRKNGLDMPK